MFWEGKKVCVAGGAGFVGSHLCEELMAQGAVVTILDDYQRGKNIPDGVYAIRKGDATKLYDCQAAFTGKFAVFNLAAAVGGVYYNIGHQAEMFWWNVQLQTVPAMVAAQMRVPIFLNVSSVCVYGADYNHPAIEECGHFGGPEKANEGYAWGKRMGERVTRWAFEGADTKYVIVRPSNIFGPCDYYDEKAHVIPALIKKFTDGRETVEVFGGSQTREFLYVTDAAKGMMFVAEHGESGEAYNLGTGGKTVITIADLAKQIRYLATKTTKGWPEIEFVSDRPTGDARRFTDSSKIRALGWKHEVGLAEGLRATIDDWLGRSADGQE